MPDFTAYIGLLRADGTEPPAESGYARVSIGDIGIFDVPAIPFRRKIVFPDVQAPGCGVVTACAMFGSSECNAPPLYIWPLPGPVNIHEGTVPVIHNGRLLLGVDVSAQIAVQSDGCGNVE